MGGLILIVMWPMVLPIIILRLLEMTMPVIAPVLLVWNLIVLAVLLVIRRFWSASGTMDPFYIKSLSSWKRAVLTLLRWGLMLFIVWEVLLVIGCLAYLIWLPDLPETLLSLPSV